jgi:hypothetical protein
MPKIVHFHELPRAEFERMKETGVTWKDVMSQFKQPIWCAYPDALDGIMGCWSLVGNLVTDEAFCKGCDCYRVEKTGKK